MKNQLKLFTNMTKPFVLFVLLFALGVGNVWAGTKTVYVETTQCSTYDNVYIHYWDDGSGDQVATQITDYFWMASIPENAKWCVFRKVDGTGYNYLENVTNSDNFFYVVSFEQSKGNSHATTHLKTYDGTEYIYWRTNPASWTAWDTGNPTHKIRLIRVDGGDNLGFVEATDVNTSDHIARYLVPAGTYIRPELYSSFDNSGSNPEGIYTKTFDFSSTSTDNFIYNFAHYGGYGNWATTFFARSAYVYFDNTNSEWDNDHNYILMGRDGASNTYAISKIEGTNNLWCHTSAISYNDFTQFCFVGDDATWGNESSSVDSRKDYADINTANYQALMDHSSRQYNLFIPAGTTKGTSLTHSAYGDYTSLNYTQTVEQKLSENGGDSYSTSTRALATVSVNSYKMTSATGTTADGGSITSGQSSKSCDAARTATVTYSVSSVTEGYTFVGWYDGDTEKSTSTTYTYEATEAKTITARFKANAYTVVFDGNDKTSGTMSNQTFYYNVAQNLTSNAYGKNGYNFGGWTTNNDGTGSSYTNGQSVSNWSSTDGASITIYAKWTQNVTLDLESGTSGSTSVTATYNSATLGSYDNPERSGYTFGGYYSGDDGTGELIINTSKELQANKTIDADVYTGAGGIWKHSSATTLHAKWTANPYTVTLNNLEASTAGTESVSVTYDATTGLTLPIEKPEKLHYDFGGYYVSNDGGETLTNIQLIDANGNWNKGVSGYTGTSGDDATWVYAGNITLYAKWTEHEYAVTLVISPAGTGTTSPASSTTAKYVTASADITATPSTGYSFREWGFSKTDEKYDVYVSDDKTYSSTDATIKINAQHNGTLTANFTANGYTVNLENKGADKDHKGTENVSVTYNAITGLTSAIEKPEKAHYDFGGYYASNDEGETLTNIQLIDASGNWNKGISGYTGTSGDYATWVYAGNITLYAKWTETAYTITPSVSPAGTGSVNTVTDAHWITPSSTITATPVNAAWVFDRWEYGEHVGPSTVSGNTVTVTSDMNSTITAHFKPRYELVGSKWNDSEDGGSMPGWTYDGTGEFTVNSFTALGTGEGTGVDLSYSCSLLANTTYNFQVHDRVTGNHGKYYASGQYINDGDHALLNQKDNNVPLAAVGAGTYTFRITNMTYDGTTDDYFPTITVERPHQLHFGTGYAGIDNLSSVTSGTTGGTLAVTTSAGSLSNEDWVTYGTDVTYTPSAATGYTFEGFYTSDEYSSRFTRDNPWVHYNVTSDDNVYAKFEEKSTSVTLANDGNGKVQISSTDKTNTTVGVTTHRELTAVPNDGYMFSSWTKTSGDDITISSTSTNPTTLRGQGAGAASGQTVTANFDYRWALSAQSDGWGSAEFIIGNISTNASGDVVGYVEIPLAANTNYQFTMKDLLTNDIYKNNNTAVQFMTYTNHTDWGFDKTYTYNCGITTAGKGTYRFTWNVTDKTMTVTYPDSYQVNYGASVGGSVTSVKDDDNNDVPNGGYVRSGGNVTYTATPNDGYTFVGWCNNDSYGVPFTTYNPWPNNSVTATSNAYAKFKSTNFVIYRTGDMAEDDRAALDDVESYAGGTISETIEFRMRVRELDKWYSLCLPFTVSAVKVWEDGTYYDLVPFYRPVVGSKTYYTGDYIIRTPKQTTDFPIAEFDDWRDPESADDYLPSMNTPYIIQWHDSYFAEEGGRYISFFGTASQDIPSFSAGSAPVSDNVVNVCVNTSMQSGSVTGAYLLDPDYGGGAWLRNEDKSARTVLPFECFIRANDVTTTKYRVLRRDTGTNGATGFETVMPDANTNKVLINGQLFIIRDNKMYNVMGMEVQK